jgi:hypothetical protein
MHPIAAGEDVQMSCFYTPSQYERQDRNSCIGLVIGKELAWQTAKLKPCGASGALQKLLQAGLGSSLTLRYVLLIWAPLGCPQNKRGCSALAEWSLGRWRDTDCRSRTPHENGTGSRHCRVMEQGERTTHRRIQTFTMEFSG